ncbi:hypothetical protein EVAR_80185_1 [Eumeta japonica]|uniref:Uncharacterized protein n=1 Tax=Eumeta variegata TaxID=151549 RepID=A0A4C1UBQ3_EUMVA|nr:hypothetical protein EVAR_80185_1 [Eumeta japonica]
MEPGQHAARNITVCNTAMHRVRYGHVKASGKGYAVRERDAIMSLATPRARTVGWIRDCTPQSSVNGRIHYPLSEFTIFDASS